MIERRMIIANENVKFESRIFGSDENCQENYSKWITYFTINKTEFPENCQKGNDKFSIMKYLFKYG